MISRRQVTLLRSSAGSRSRHGRRPASPAMSTWPSPSPDADAEALVRGFIASGYGVVAMVEQEATGRFATARLVTPGSTPDAVVVDLLFATSGIEPELVAQATQRLPDRPAPRGRADAGARAHAGGQRRRGHAGARGGAAGLDDMAFGAASARAQAGGGGAGARALHLPRGPREPRGLGPSGPCRPTSVSSCPAGCDAGARRGRSGSERARSS